MTVPSELSRLLRRLPVFGALDEEESGHLAQRCQALRYAPGMCIFAEGDLGDSVMVLVTGRVEIACAVPDGPELVIATLDPGALIGEMAILDAAPRSASARALEESVVLVIDAPTFFELVSIGHAGASEILRTVIKQVAGRIRHLEATVDRIILGGGGGAGMSAEVRTLRRVLA